MSIYPTKIKRRYDFFISSQSRSWIELSANNQFMKTGEVSLFLTLLFESPSPQVKEDNWRDFNLLFWAFISNQVPRV